jgi:hypothetical protein
VIARHLRIRDWPQAPARAMHPSRQFAAQTNKVEVLRSGQTHCFRLNSYGPLVSPICRVAELMGPLGFEPRTKGL